jgi:hypothetical protein
LSPDRPKNRHEQRDDQAAQLFIDMARQDRRFADENAGDECTEHGVDADQLRGQRHRRHDDQDRSDDRKVAPEIVVRHRMRLNTMRRPIVKLATIKSPVPIMARLTDHTSMVPAGEAEGHGDDQPIVSSRMADATMTCPRSRRMKLTSRITIATIFTEEMESAVPRKIAVTKRPQQAVDTILSSPSSTTSH